MFFWLVLYENVFYAFKIFAVFWLCLIHLKSDFFAQAAFFEWLQVIK